MFIILWLTAFVPRSSLQASVLTVSVFVCDIKVDLWGTSICPSGAARLVVDLQQIAAQASSTRADASPH